MKSYLVLITLISLFAMTSCGPVNDDSGQTQQVPVPPPGVGQTDPANTVSPQGQNETPLQVSPAQSNPGVMLNPPHGEPYHRCDIPVGDPLPATSSNSPRQPTTNQLQTSAPQPPASNPGVTSTPKPMEVNVGQVNPAQTQTTAPASTGVKPQLNPPHGQPFHRCDIAVGSPLP